MVILWFNYLRQGGYVTIVVFIYLSLCVFVFVSSFAQKLLIDLHEIFRKGWQWVNEQVIN